jgi:hypothetical protein
LGRFFGGRFTTKNATWGGQNPISRPAAGQRRLVAIFDARFTTKSTKDGGQNMVY